MKTLHGAILASLLALPVQAQETINLTIASSHPTVVPWVGMIQTHFMARKDEILASTGNFKIEWNEAFGGHRQPVTDRGRRTLPSGGPTLRVDPRPLSRDEGE